MQGEGAQRGWTSRVSTELLHRADVDFTQVPKLSTADDSQNRGWGSRAAAGVWRESRETRNNEEGTRNLGLTVVCRGGGGGGGRDGRLVVPEVSSMAATAMDQSAELWTRLRSRHDRMESERRQAAERQATAAVSRRGRTRKQGRSETPGQLLLLPAPPARSKLARCSPPGPNRNMTASASSPSAALQAPGCLRAGFCPGGGLPGGGAGRACLAERVVSALCRLTFVARCNSLCGICRTTAFLAQDYCALPRALRTMS